MVVAVLCAVAGALPGRRPSAAPAPRGGGAVARGGHAGAAQGPVPRRRRAAAGRAHQRARLAGDRVRPGEYDPHPDERGQRGGGRLDEPGARAGGEGGAHRGGARANARGDLHAQPHRPHRRGVGVGRAGDGDLGDRGALGALHQAVRRVQDRRDPPRRRAVRRAHRGGVAALLHHRPTARLRERRRDGRAAAHAHLLGPRRAHLRRGAHRARRGPRRDARPALRLAARRAGAHARRQLLPRVSQPLHDPRDLAAPGGRLDRLARPHAPPRPGAPRPLAHGRAPRPGEHPRRAHPLPRRHPVGARPGRRRGQRGHAPRAPGGEHRTAARGRLGPRARPALRPGRLVREGDLHQPPRVVRRQPRGALPPSPSATGRPAPWP
jgi:hypothetical protein